MKRSPMKRLTVLSLLNLCIILTASKHVDIRAQRDSLVSDDANQALKVYTASTGSTGFVEVNTKSSDTVVHGNVVSFDVDGDSVSCVVNEQKVLTVSVIIETNDPIEHLSGPSEHLSIITTKSDVGSSVEIRQEWISIRSDSKIILEKLLKTDIGKKFQDWISKFIHSTMILKKITIKAITMFTPNNLGLLYVDAEVYRKDVDANGKAVEKKIPGMALIRGNAVAILVVIEDHLNNKYLLLLIQDRVPAGATDLLEVPAGMLDNSNNFKGKAADELYEETGLSITADSDLIDITSPHLGADSAGFIHSCGGSDERIKYYLFTKKYDTDKEFVEFNMNLKHERGNRNENERIKLKLIPFAEGLAHSVDAKLFIGLSLYRLHEQAKLTKGHSEAEQTKLTEGHSEADTARRVPKNVGHGVVGLETKPTTVQCTISDCTAIVAPVPSRKANRNDPQLLSLCNQCEHCYHNTIPGKCFKQCHLITTAQACFDNLCVWAPPTLPIIGAPFFQGKKLTCYTVCENLSVDRACNHVPYCHWNNGKCGKKETSMYV